MRDLVMDKDWDKISDLCLKESDINLLHVINEEDLTNFTFEGLKNTKDSSRNTFQSSI